jgi:hypothetical protein
VVPAISWGAAEAMAAKAARVMAVKCMFYVFCERV